MNSRSQLLIAITAALALSVWYMNKKQAAPVKKNFDTIIVGTNSEFPPFSFTNDKNELIGFDIDVMR